MRWCSVDISPRFFEVDSYQMVNNMFYLSWFEMGRFAIAQKAGIVCPRFLQEKLAFVVSRAEVLYRKPVALTDTVTCESIIEKAAASRLVFRHRILNRGNHGLHAEGTTEVVCTRDGRMLLKLPAWIVEAVAWFTELWQTGRADERS